MEIIKEKISIICCTYNCESNLPLFIDSVRSQTSDKYELIIIDGGSTDNTIKVINSNRDIVDKFISEPDEGIYDAWNKGIRLATSNWICFVGSDDLLRPYFVETYCNVISAPSETNVEYISSKVNYFNNTNRSLRILGKPWIWNRFRRQMTTAHVGSLHHIHLFKDVGLYDVNYKIVGDYELLLRKGIHLNTTFVDSVTIDMKAGGVSLSLAALKERFKAHTNTAKMLFFEAMIYFLIGIIALFKFKIEILVDRWMNRISIT